MDSEVKLMIAIGSMFLGILIAVAIWLDWSLWTSISVVSLLFIIGFIRG